MREVELKLNEPKVTRKYFAQVKFAEHNEHDFDAEFNARNLTGDYPLDAENTVEAITYLDSRYQQTDPNSSWVHYEVYEEETITVRRRVFVAERRREEIHRLNQRYAKSPERLAQKEAVTAEQPAVATPQQSGLEQPVARRKGLKGLLRRR